MDVDEQLADFLEHLWSKGYVTLFSCQSGLPEIHGDTPAPTNYFRYIMFPDIEYAERFESEYGGVIDPKIYHENRRCIRSFDIPTKEQLSALN